MKAILTVIGRDKTGIIAKVSGALFEVNANILDISQTVMQEEYFAMIMLVDLAGMRVSFDELKNRLDSVEKEIGVQVKIQREEIFNAMHRI